MGDRLGRLDDNPISRGVSWLFTRVAAPIGVVGGVVILVIGVVEAATSGHDTLGLLIMGAVWLGFIALSPSRCQAKTAPDRVGRSLAHERWPLLNGVVKRNAEIRARTEP